MRTFIAATSLMPNYGGPAYSVSRLTASLAAAGARVGLWTADQSASRTPLLAPAGDVCVLGGTAAKALADFGRVDVLHDNGLWLPHNHRLAALSAARGVSRVVSTRGMLEPWAAKHKWIKKSVAWALYQRRDLHRAHVLHTTGSQEAENLERFRLDVPIRVIPNGVDLPEPPRREDLPGGTHARTALFLGRIYPIKGLPMLIRAWAKVRPSEWRLRIAGPDEAGHRAEIERIVAAEGLNDVVSFSGPVEGDAKRAALFDADLLILPSHSESFGMAVAEALAHGVPALTTTATPWTGLMERRCGWCVEPSPQGIADALRQATSLDIGALRAMGTNGRKWVAADFGWAAIANQFIAAYELAMDAGKAAA
jgi:glycosyltransferase involved in cell wall biosynthesis